MELIWIVAECPYPPNSGGRIVTWNRLNILAKKYAIHLFCAIDSAEERKYKSELNKICKSVNFYQRRKISALLKSFSAPFPAVSRWFKEMKADVNKLDKEINAKCILVDSPQMMGNVPFELYKKTILNQYNIEYKAFASISDTAKNLLKKIFFKVTALQMKWYEENLYRKNTIACYTFVSSEEKLFFEKTYNINKTILLPIGTACIRSIDDKTNERSIIFVGKMSYNPNEQAVKWFVSNVWPSIKKAVPDIKFYIVGKEPSASLVELNKADKDVIVTGMVDSVTDYYSRASVVVIPIISGGGVNVKVLEALGMGKLVVTTSKGVEGTAFVPGTHLIVADSAEEFAEKVIDAVQNPNEQMEKNAYQYCVEHYSWEASCNPLIDFLSN